LSQGRRSKLAADNALEKIVADGAVEPPTI
jgi:hypothetical protein